MSATVVLPTPPFGLNTAITVARRLQPSWPSGPGLQDGPAAVVDGLAADAHGLDPPADRIGRVGPREVLVAGAVVVHLGHPLVRLRRTTTVSAGIGRLGLLECAPVLADEVLVGFAVEDGDGDVAPGRQGRDSAPPVPRR